MQRALGEGLGQGAGGRGAGREHQHEVALGVRGEVRVAGRIGVQHELAHAVRRAAEQDVQAPAPRSQQGLGSLVVSEVKPSIRFSVYLTPHQENCVLSRMPKEQQVIFEPFGQDGRQIWLACCISTVFNCTCQCGRPCSRARRPALLLRLNRWSHGWQTAPAT